MQNIGKNIKTVREEKHMTQDQLAEQLHVTRQTVSNWENGKTEPDVDTLTRIAEVFDLSVETLIYGQKKRRFHVKFIVNNAPAESLTLGTVLAVVISYTHWHHIGWAILHGIFSWAYVIYYAIKYL